VEDLVVGMPAVAVVGLGMATQADDDVLRTATADDAGGLAAGAGTDAPIRVARAAGGKGAGTDSLGRAAGAAGGERAVAPPLTTLVEEAAAEVRFAFLDSSCSSGEMGRFIPNYQSRSVRCCYFCCSVSLVYQFAVASGIRHHVQSF
jgi:hypothetical protein